jgi:hypothetical protein
MGHRDSLDSSHTGTPAHAAGEVGADRPELAGRAHARSLHLPVVAAAVAVLVAVTLGGTLALTRGIGAGEQAGGRPRSTNSVGASSRTAGFPAALLRVLAQQQIEIEVVPSGSVRAAVDLATATATVKRELPPGTRVDAAELASVSFPFVPPGFTRRHIVCWVFTSDPRGQYSNGPPGVQPVAFNYRVDFVDAANGRWVEARAGDAAGLPCLG